MEEPPEMAFRTNEEVRGRPVLKEVEGDTDGERECEVCTSVAMEARYCMTFFVFSVFPAPDSPLRLILD